MATIVDVTLEKFADTIGMVTAEELLKTLRDKKVESQILYVVEDTWFTPWNAILVFINNYEAVIIGCDPCRLNQSVICSAGFGRQ